MQEQPPIDPPRREPREPAGRSRTPKATFTPPPAPPAPAAGPAEAPADSEPQRPRRARPAPVVLFQPPDPEQPLPRQTRPTAEAANPVANAATPIGEATASADPGAEPTAPQDPAATPPGHTRTPRKAAPAARKRAGDRPAVDAASSADEPPHTDAVAPVTPTPPGDAEPTRLASSAGAPVGETPGHPPARAGDRSAVAPRAKNTTSPRKSAAKSATPKATQKKAAPARKAATSPRQRAEAATPAGESLATADALVREPALAERQSEQPRPNRAPTLEPAPEPATGRTREGELRVITARLLDHPGFAPELLALAAVEAVGPRARDWAEGLRNAYPDADADGLARLATRRFVRLAGAGGATAAVAGLFAPVAELAAVLWSQANLVLHLAAAYGRDPLHPDRATELLVLTRVHPDADSARSALDAARAATGPADEPWPRAAEAAWRLAAPLAAQAGGWLALLLASRLLPGAAVLVAAAGNVAAAERLAARAATAYRETPGRRVTAS